MRFIIVTGMSGAGKSAVVEALEDVGLYCVDNIPPSLIPKFAHLGLNGQDPSDNDRVALVVDARGLRRGIGGEAFIQQLTGALAELDREKVSYQILFLDAATDELINRYKITRRPHPLMGTSDSLSRAINQERELLRQIKERADMVIDTTLLSAAQLRSNIHDLFRSNDPDKDDFVVNCISFGFKFGVPVDADLMFDVRCLPNPFYVPELKHKTGLDEEVVDFVMSHPEAQELLKRYESFLEYALPLYVKEGKSQLTIAVGCTGGKHRSITFARKIAEYCEKLGYKPGIQHRDSVR